MKAELARMVRSCPMFSHQSGNLYEDKNPKSVGCLQKMNLVHNVYYI